MKSNNIYEGLNKLSNNEFEEIEEINNLINNKLNYKTYKNIKKFLERKNNNIYTIVDNKDLNKDVYIKYITLVDFLKYLIGKYKNDNIEDKPLNIGDISLNSKYDRYINDINNYAYVDSLFYNLTNDLLREYDFLHGIECYDSFLCKKKECKINITDDLEYLCDSNFFNKNINKLFHFEDNEITELFINSHKNELLIEDDVDLTNVIVEDVSINKSQHKNIFDENNSLENVDILLENIDKNDNIELNFINKYNSSYSTEDSEDNDEQEQLNNSEEIDENKIDENKIDENKIDENKIDENKIDENESDENESDEDESNENDKDESNEDEIDEDESDENESDENDSEEDESVEDESGEEESEEESEEEESEEEESEEEESEEEDDLYLYINKIPTQVVVLEKCEDTLDNLLENDMLTLEQLESAIFQIVTILYLYQKKFEFTHNDLHTNNIMYVKTDLEYIIYTIKNINYKIPTYGRIYKIIDFGRSIYKYNGNMLCSDSFSSNGTAHTQYNFKPYYNDKKPIIEPNYSFDLCRLSCSIFDFICDDINNINKYRESCLIYDMIFSWLYDDNNNNVLYKSNGEDKYPGFKLYKMITRNVHNHIPEKQYNHEVFKKYIVEDIVEDISDYIKKINIDKIIKS